jgi:hypothetical protein
MADPRVKVITVQGSGGKFGELISEIIEQVQIRDIFDDVIEHVTPGIIREILWNYGDPDMPEVTDQFTIKLLNLVRFAHAQHLDKALKRLDEGFHGYVLGLWIASKDATPEDEDGPDESGIEMLRGLLKGQEQAEQKLVDERVGKTDKWGGGKS